MTHEQLKIRKIKHQRIFSPFRMRYFLKKNGFLDSEKHTDNNKNEFIEHRI